MSNDSNTMKELLKRITDARAELAAEYPFYGRLILYLIPAVADCGTACTDMKHIIFDPEFAAKLSDEELKFVMLHEVMHCVLKHCIRGKTLNNYLFNVACDIVVNSLIFESMGVDSLTVAGFVPMHLAPNGKEGREYTAEVVYRMLISSNPDSSYFIDEFGQNTIDNHNIWQELTETELAVNESIWEHRIKEASKNCGSGSGISTAVSRYLKETNHMPGTNWHQVLADFVVHNRGDFTYDQRDCRFPGKIIIPKFVDNVYGDKISNFWFCIDTSASVSDAMLAAVYSEILGACRQFDEIEGKIAFFDTHLSDFFEFKDEDDVLTIKPIGGGGTSFHCIFEKLQNCKEDEKPTGIIILTDGYAYFPEESAAENIPVLWAIVNSDVQPPWGIEIHINM